MGEWGAPHPQMVSAGIETLSAGTNLFADGYGLAES
jgi:hypothetical protein